MVCTYESLDDLKMYRGYSVKINEYVTVRQPSVGDICEFGENDYYNMVYGLCAVGADMKWQLSDMGIDYAEVEDFDLFSNILIKGLDLERTSILFGDTLDFSKMRLVYNTKLDENVLIQSFPDGNYLQIDRYVYSAMIGTLRRIHKLSRNNEIAYNDATKKIMIEEERSKHEYAKSQPIKPYLFPFISAMVNTPGFKHDEVSVFNMGIFAFMDSVVRTGKIKNADLLLASGYSGFGVDLKKIDKNDLNWMGAI